MEKTPVLFVRWSCSSVEMNQFPHQELFGVDGPRAAGGSTEKQQVDNSTGFTCFFFAEYRGKCSAGINAGVIPHNGFEHGDNPQS